MRLDVTMFTILSYIKALISEVEVKRELGLRLPSFTIISADKRDKWQRIASSISRSLNAQGLTAGSCLDTCDSVPGSK